MSPLAAPFVLEGTNGEGVLLIHGFTGTPAHFRMLGRALNEHGYTVFAPLLAGHGTTLEDMDRTGRREWIESAEEGLRLLRDRFGTVHVGGLSMGGLLSLYLASEHPVASVTTIDTPMKLWDRRQPLVHVVKYVQRFRTWENPEPVPEGEAAEYFIQYDGFPVGAASELVKLTKEVRRRLSKVSAPLLVIQSLADETVKPLSAEIIADRAGSRDSRIVWLEHSRHNALLDTERDTIAQAMLEHLRGR